MKIPTTRNPFLTAAAAAVVFLSVPSQTASSSLVKITEDFGLNPTNVSFYLYVPDSLPAAPSKPAILVNPHWCHGTASAAFSGGSYPALARQHGFIIIYPETPSRSTDQCWDVSSRETLTHNGGGDSLGIVSMVAWTVARYGADPGRVFVTGVSSGAMMTNVLVGSYPDVFAAGSAWAGVPFGCFAAPGNNSGIYGYWNDQCATGKIKHTAAEWKDLVEAAYYPGSYDGWRPKFQTFHGTKDEVLDYVNFEEQIKQWTAVLGLSDIPTGTEQDVPLAGWTKRSYGPPPLGSGGGWFEAYSVKDVTHDIRIQAETVINFFQLNCTSGCFSWGQKGLSPAT